MQNLLGGLIQVQLFMLQMTDSGRYLTSTDAVTAMHLTNNNLRNSAKDREDIKFGLGIQKKTGVPNRN
jgi:hypothetical protein